MRINQILLKKFKNGEITCYYGGKPIDETKLIELLKRVSFTNQLPSLEPGYYYIKKDKTIARALISGAELTVPLSEFFKCHNLPKDVTLISFEINSEEQKEIFDLCYEYGVETFKVNSIITPEPNRLAWDKNRLTMVCRPLVDDVLIPFDTFRQLIKGEISYSTELAKENEVKVLVRDISGIKTNNPDLNTSLFTLDYSINLTAATNKCLSEVQRELATVIRKATTDYIKTIPKPFDWRDIKTLEDIKTRCGILGFDCETISIEKIRIAFTGTIMKHCTPEQIEHIQKYIIPLIF